MNQTIGGRIAAYRKEKGMTQEDLAKHMGVSAQAVSKWENDLSCPDISALPKLCRLLGISTDELLSGKKEQVSFAPEGQRKSLDELTLRIHVHSADGDRVKVNLPMSLVKTFSQLGLEIGQSMSGLEGNSGLQNLDIDKILELAEHGALGKLVEMESSEGDTVEVIVE